MRISQSPQRQSGSVLLVALVLLLLAGLLTLFALKVGVFEQRSTGNDVRSKVANEVAEAGLAQAAEFLIRQHPDMLKNPLLWERCHDDDTTFPCGAISAGTYDDDGDASTAEVSRRGSMFRLKEDTTNVITGIDPVLAKFMLKMPTASKIASMTNSQAVAYGVAPVVCFARAPAAATTAIPCGSVGGTSNTSIATLVSVVRLPGENTSSTLVQTIGQYPKLPPELINTPPITAAGAVDVTGNLQIVTNPNAGGTGVPVSAWSRLNLDKHGTPNTCYADEFFRYTQGSATPVAYQGTIRCDECQCGANGAPTTLSYDASGVDRCSGGFTDCEGIDVLDVDAGTNSNTLYNVNGHVGANYNVRSDALSYPTCEFPPDLFRYVFGVQAWNDTNNDCFAESKAANVAYQNPDTGTIGSVPPDEAYLYKVADRIIPLPQNAALVTAAQNGTSALLSSDSTSGIVWCQTGCNVSGQVGTPSAPVLLVLDGPARIQGTVFGIVFVRDTGTALNPATGSSLTGNCPNDCQVQMNAGSAIYGALIVQGQMKVNGTAAVIFDKSVINGVISDAGLQYATLPGAWTDQQSF